MKDLEKKQKKNNVRNLCIIWRGIMMHIIKGAKSKKCNKKREYENVFKKYHAIISPTSPTPAFKIGEKN